MYEWLRFHCAFHGFMLNRERGKLILTFFDKCPIVKTFDDTVLLYKFVKEKVRERAQK